MRKLILNGEIEEAEELLIASYPEILIDKQKKDYVRFHILCQKYVELVRRGDIYKALEVGEKDLAPFLEVKHYATALNDIIAVISYTPPAKSRLGHLFSHAQRETVADVVNAAILGLKQKENSREIYLPSSVLEILLKQLVQCHRQLHMENKNQGEVFRLSDHLTPTKAPYSKSDVEEGN